MIDTLAQVIENRQIASGYRLLTLQFAEPIAARAGQFAMLKAHNAFEPLLRRALAIYRIKAPDRLSFLYQVMGRGTQALAALTTGGEVDVLLPLGNGWLEGERAKPRQALVVAGGIGSASVLLLAEQLHEQQIETQIFFGAGSHETANGCGLADFEALEIPLIVTTDDGSLGEHGFVTAPLERYLRDKQPTDAVIYTCGPWVMMRRVAEIAAQYQVACYASLEAPMGCGFGVCVGCVVAIKDADPKSYQAYKRVCIDGSIFPAEMIRWDVAAMTH
jgi:dihydroorotate dehydrogenase electron transfer subunit